MNWYARIDGQKYGPVTVQQLQQWAMESRILATTEVRQGETGTWVPAAQVQGLMPTAAPSPTPQAQRLNTPSVPQAAMSRPSVKTISAGSRNKKTQRRGRNPDSQSARQSRRTLRIFENIQYAMMTVLMMAYDAAGYFLGVSIAGCVIGGIGCLLIVLLFVLLLAFTRPFS